MNRRILIVSIAAAAAAGAAVGGKGLALKLFGSSSAGGRVLRIGHLVALDMAPLFLGVEKGFFKEAGFDVQTRFFPNPGDNNAALAGGSLDLTVNPFTLPYLGRSAGGDFQVLCSMGGSGVMEMIAQPESGLKSLDDLAGAAGRPQKVRIGTLQGDTLDVVIYRALKERGVGYDQFDMVFFNDLLAMVQAFKSKQIDVLSHIKPYTTELKQTMGAVSLGTNADVWGEGTPNCVLMGMRPYIDANGPAIRAFIDALTKGYQYGRQFPAEAAAALDSGRYYQVARQVLEQALREQPEQFLATPNEKGLGVAIGDLVALGYMKPVDMDIFRREFFPAK